jgi:UDP-N-acetylmuramoylalanine--D-glutamate ligase
MIASMSDRWHEFAQSLGVRSVAVVGLGMSGLATALKLHHAGISVYVWDDGASARDEAVAKRLNVCAPEQMPWPQIAFLLLSPGIPLYAPTAHPAAMMAQSAGVEIIGDIELWHRLGTHSRTIGITGTNGKSTTTALIAHVLASAGVSCAMAGNIGVPIFSIADTVDWMVIELSSFQLDLCPRFAPDIAVLLNITPDHLDRHGTMQRYIDSKVSIFKGEGAAIVATDDAYCATIYEELRQDKDRSVISISADASDYAGIGVLRGRHNAQNIAAAAAVCRLVGVSDSDFRQGLSSFPGLPHRQFMVLRTGDIRFINDSKATNAEAAAHALAAYEDIFWIVGGRAKEGGLSGLEGFSSKIRQSYLIGEAAADFQFWMAQQNIGHQLCGTLDKAVQAAYSDARQAGKGTILLSPACASYDQFQNYEQRGHDFMQHVKRLAGAQDQ